MFYKISYIEYTNKPVENTTRLYQYVEAENEQAAIETVKAEREFEVDGLKSEIKEIEYIKEITEEEYQKVHGDENSNPLLIHGLPKGILEMFDINIDNL